MARKNLLCFGDNLTFLKNTSLFPDEAVDLIYLDPPFNSQRGYNVLFKEVDGTPSASQIQAFDDTWQWDKDAADRYEEIQATASGQVVAVMSALQIMLGHSPMFAYLVQMCARLVQLHRVLKKTGSLYLHCDPTASHYLKMVLDAIFGTRNFRNEITWKRTSSHNDAAQGLSRYARNHDLLFYYSKDREPHWNLQFAAYDEAYLEKHYRNLEVGTERRYKTSDLTAAKPGGDTSYEWKGVPPPSGRYWAYSRANMERFESEGRLVYSSSGMPRLKHYLDEMSGVVLGDVWDDIPPINSQAQERLGYPTQKPLALLKRIILASSNPGDVVLDPFCGCGTTIDAVETLNRENPGQKKRTWLGIDITYLAVTLIKNRLGRFENPRVTFDIEGEPADTRSAEFLAHRDRYEFQYWALGLIGARPWTDQKKKGADKGIDGVRFFNDDGKGPKSILVQVKSGHVQRRDIGDFRTAIEREKAAMGVFITLEPPTRDMNLEALEAGKYRSPLFNSDYPKLQILTIEQLLADPNRPNPQCLQIPLSVPADTFKQAAKQEQERGKQESLPLT